MISFTSEDFVQRWGEARSSYQSAVRTYLQRNYAIIAEQSDLSWAELEAHATTYLIDPLLSALNWSIQDHVIVELVTWREDRKSRRLDYAGIEAGTGEVSLLIEAKRPNFTLPTISVLNPNQFGVSPRSSQSHLQQIVDYTAHHLTGLKTPLGDEQVFSAMPRHFADALAQLREYYLDVRGRQRRAPKRAVLTNGSWLMIFTDPENAFCDGASAKAELIHLFEDGDSVMSQASLVFDLLERNRCSALPLPVSMAHVMDHLANTKVEGVSFALHVAVDRQTNSEGPRPILTIDPTILVLTESGKAWLRISAGEWFTFPNAIKDRVQHVKKCKTALRDLQMKFERLMGRKIGPVKLVDYFDRSAWRDELPAVTKVGPKSYLVVTGNEPHFLKTLAAFEKCQYHSNEGSLARRVLTAPAGPSEDRVTFQSVGQIHCCVAKSMFELKSSKGTGSQGEAPWKSSQENGGICKIYEFERFLCCKMCAFDPICSRPMSKGVVCES